MARRVKKTLKTKKVRLSEPVSAPEGPPEGWVLGSTCLTCRTHYKGWVAQFQDGDGKDGKWDVTKQLPHTAPDYPICYDCLPGHWRVVASRWGMEKEVLRVYGSR